MHLISSTLATVLLVQTAEGGWEPGIGDPTFIGWFTSFAYLWAAYVCFRAYGVAQARHGGATRLSSTWAALCLAMFVLGINKELDLQSLLTVVGMRLARNEGWYEHRHVVQVWFIRALLLAAVGGAALVTWLMWRYWRELWLAAVGCGLVGLFVLSRAAFFNRVHVLLADDSLGESLSWLLELSGIACIGFGALRYRKRPRSKRTAAARS